jgi:hypothetical protein
MGDGPGLGIELYEGYPNAPGPPEDPLRQGEPLDAIFNEECNIELSPTSEVIVEGTWRHTTYDYTFEDLDPGITHLHVLFFGFDQGSAGMLIDEMVIDMVVHDGDTPPAGPGRPLLRIPRAGQARNPNPANNEEHVLLDVNLSWAPDPCLTGPLDYDVWFGTDSNMANNPKIASNIGANTVDPNPGGDLAYGTVYYWRVDTNDTNGREGLDWTFATLGLADDESPADGATGVKPSVILSWVEDDYASLRDIYFGTDEAAVTDANTNTAGIYRGQIAPLDPCDPNRNTYDPPELLDLLTDAFWRIDEVGVAGAVKGVVWRFKSAPYFVVDDFEPYLDLTALRAVWKDWYADPRAQNKNDAQVFLENNADYVYGGDQSIEFTYRCYKKTGPDFEGSYAEADTTDLQAGSDWTASGVEALVLYFLGATTNGQDHVYNLSQDQMYVELVDGDAVPGSGIVKYDTAHGYDMNDIKEASWHEWNIDLADPCLADVNQANVAKIYIGFGGEAKTGQSAPGAGAVTLLSDTVWFDDIQLHPPRCVPSVSLPYGDTTGPYTGGEEPEPTDGDCIIDYWDVLLMSDDWLVTDYKVDPAPPSDANLILEYLFDTDFSDTSSNGRTGVPGGAFPPSSPSGFMNLQDGYLDVPFGADNPFHGSEDYTIFITYKSSTLGAIPLITSCDPCLPTDWDDPNVDVEAVLTLYSPMAVFVEQSHSGGPSNPDDLLAIHDNFMKDGANIDKQEVGGIGSWHTVAAVFDADGGTCPSDADPIICTPGQTSGLVTIYLDGTPGTTNIDPNIPEDPNYDIVRIGASANILHHEDMGFGDPFVVDINDVRIYAEALTHAEILYLAGISEATYFPNESPANLVPKVPPGGPFDPNNVDIVNFRDYGVMSSNWLDEILWPERP